MTDGDRNGRDNLLEGLAINLMLLDQPEHGAVIVSRIQQAKDDEILDELVVMLAKIAREAYQVLNPEGWREQFERTIRALHTLNEIQDLEETES